MYANLAVLDAWLMPSVVLAPGDTVQFSSTCWSPWEINSMGSVFQRKQMTVSFYQNRFLVRKACFFLKMSN